MTETINSYNLDNLDSLIPMDRKEFYEGQIKAFKTTGKPTMAVEDVNIILFNESGEFILQKRSSHKGHNANLIDKSIGGHIVNGDAPDYTAMIESVQELQVPSIVLRNKEDFTKTLETLKSYLSSTAVMQYLDTKVNHNTKIMNGEKVQIVNKTHLYVGVYGGSVKNVDKEAKGILFYEMEELEQEMKDFPETFTQDLHRILVDYRDYFKEFVRQTGK